MTARYVVAQLFYGDLPYFKYARAINQQWCLQNGHVYAELGKPSVPAIFTEPGPYYLHPNWWKVWSLLEGVKKLDANVLVMDADAYVVNQQLDLEALWTTLFPEPQQVLAAGWDQASKEVVWDKAGINAGVFAMKPRQPLHELLTEWSHVPWHDKEYRTRWPVEQAGFNRNILRRWKKFINLVPYNLLNGHDGINICHLMSMSSEKRVEVMAEVCSQRGISV